MMLFWGNCYLITNDTLNNVRDNKLYLWPYNQIAVIKKGKQGNDTLY